jgi:hypothetical protein
MPGSLGQNSLRTGKNRELFSPEQGIVPPEEGIRWFLVIQ